MAKKETFQCKKCNTLNPLPKNAFQSVSCFNCGAKHAIVVVKGAREFHPFHQQERGQEVAATPASSISVNLDK
jgi:transcription elongation factor Elf1